MRPIALAALAALAAGPAAALGGAPTLRRPLSARASAMAEAYAAVPGGLTSLGINPAGLSAARRPELSSSFSSGILDDSFGFVGWAQPMPLGTAAAGLSYYDGGSVDLRFPSGAVETRAAQRDFVGHLAWSLPLPAGVSLGATGKYYRFELAQEARASGAAADVGAQWRTPLPGLTVGGSIQNLGPGVKFEREADPLPTIARGGLSWSWAGAPASESDAATYLTETRFVASADAVKVRDEAVAGALGAEIAMSFGGSTSIALRGGWRLNSEFERLTLGMGMREGRFTLDYAMGDKRSLGQVHHASLGVRF